MADFLPTNQLDFESLRDNLITYLKNDSSPFKDYNFEGSNMAVLLDLLSYNSYLNAFYLNMVGNEMFMDSAQVYDSVVSHAKLLNYNVRSYTSAKATVSLNINVTNNQVQTVTIPKYTKFNASTSAGSFIFSTKDNQTVHRDVSGQFLADVDLYEGYVITEKYIANTQIDHQKFIISNKQVDTSSITVKVYSTQNDVNYTEYKPTTSLYGLNQKSIIYFLQPSTLGKYEIMFGDGVFGKALTTGNMIEVTYRVSTGEAPNGVGSFTLAGTISGYTATATTLAVAAGGSAREDIESVRFRAPKHFQTQDRAITKGDYKTLLLNNFSELNDVNVYGGEDLTVPRYGIAVVSASTKTGYPLTNRTKADILIYLKSKSPLSINAEIQDPEHLYLIVTSNITYNKNTTILTSAQIQTLAATAISDFNDSYLKQFNKTFRYSKLTADINNINSSVVGNETSILLAKTYTPPLNQQTTFTIDFQNPIKKDDTPTSRPLTNEFTLFSSEIMYNNIPSYIAEDGNGVLFVYQFTNTGRNILNNNVGTVNYETGIVTVSGITINGYTGDGITFFVGPRKQDVVSSKNNIIQIATNLSQINVTAVDE